MMMGGVRLDRDAALAANIRLVSTGASLQSSIDEVEGMGCLVKDLDIGLIDFPTVYRGADACICWKLGEPSIGFGHLASEGFAGRKPIDADFRTGHGRA